MRTSGRPLCRPEGGIPRGQGRPRLDHGTEATCVARRACKRRDKGTVRLASALRPASRRIGTVGASELLTAVSGEAGHPRRHGCRRLKRRTDAA